MTTLLNQRATWTFKPDMEVVTEWIEEDNEDTYADQIEAYTVRIADFYDVTEDTLEKYATILTEWIYSDSAELAELHAQWNESLTDEEIKESFYVGVRDTLGASANLF